MTISDEIEDYVEYLVEYQHVEGLSELSKEERAKLTHMVLLENYSLVYAKMLRIMNKKIKKAVYKFKL